MKTIHAIMLAAGVLGVGCAHTASQPATTAGTAAEARVVVTVPHGRHQDGPPAIKSEGHTSAKQSY